MIEEEQWLEKLVYTILEKKVEFIHKYNCTPKYVVVPEFAKGKIDGIYNFEVIESPAIKKIEDCKIY